MKNIIKKIFILCLIFMIPFIVKANAIYTEAVNHANNYINGFMEYDKYLIFPTKEWYYFDTSVPNSGATFSRGGFLSRKEYLITNYDNKSYLSTGIQFWTLTPGIVDSSKIFIIDYSDKERDTSLKSGIRVTEFIEPSTRAKGSGSRNNPWYFLPKYKISLETSDYRKGQISNEISKTNKISGECNDVVTTLSTNIYNDEQIMVRVCPSAEYEYISTDCVNNIVSSSEDNNVLKISKINKNILCKVNFAKKAYKIVLDTNGGSQIDIKELYLSPELNWYKDNNSRINDKPITKINKLPEKEGYVFAGFYTTTNGGTQIIDETGNIINKDAYKEDGTMYANWEFEVIDSTEIVNDFKCDNKTVGEAPYLLKYTGDCSIHDDGDGKWRVKFLTSGDLTLKFNINADIFLVGGGGGNSGGGGYTKTQRNVILKSGTTYKIDIGDGGTPTSSGEKTAFSFGSTSYYSDGGLVGPSGNGGSGGGAHKEWRCKTEWHNLQTGYTCVNGIYHWKEGHAGGAFGNNGRTESAGLGQRITTCEFGEGTTSKCTRGNDYAYSGGGSTNDTNTIGGGGGKDVDGKKNTGGGGGLNASGGSGVVVIRQNSDNVRFDMQNGTGGDTGVKVEKGNVMPTINIPSRTHIISFNGNGGTPTSSSLTSTYKFGGYYYGSTKYYNANGTSAKEWDKASATTLTASWSEGSIKLPSATRSGYTFNGWYTAASGGTKIGNAGVNYNPTSATTLYAQWTVNNIIVIYNASGGKIATPVTSNDGVTYYWKINNGSIRRSTDDISYTDQFFKRTYIDKIDLVNYNYAKYVNLSKPGYRLLEGKEWCTDQDGKGNCYNQLKQYSAEEICPNIKIADCNIKLYANWVVNTYEVTLDKQLGTGGTDSVTVTYAENMPTISIPSKEGYTFGGYYSDKNGKGTQYYNESGESAKAWNIASNTTLYAKWTANKYTVTLNANGATDAGTKNVSATYGIEMPKINRPSKSYKVTFNGNSGTAGSPSLTSTYTFGGYYLGSTQYYTASGVSARAWDKASATTLTASWSGGAITLPNATRNGYTFNGWYTAKSGGTKIGNAGASYTPTAAITLYANWVANTYKVTLDKQLGTGGTDSVTATYEIAMPTISIPSREGYKFGGYYSNINGTGTQYYKADGTSAKKWNIANNTTLYAKWKAN